MGTNPINSPIRPSQCHHGNDSCSQVREQSRMSNLWNVARRHAQGERFLRMAGASDVVAARALWKDPGTPVHRRCLAARAIGLLGKHGPSWLIEGVDDDDSPLGRARRHGKSDAERRRYAESRMREQDEAAQKTRLLGASSPSKVIGILQDRSESTERRVEAATILRGLRCRDAVGPLIETLGEGERSLSWMCMSALTAIASRQGARRLIQIAGGTHPLPARQEAIYTLWQLEELRAEPLFIRLSSAVDTEEEYTRDMATEALGNTWVRRRTQRALSERLFDPSISVRYSALCAVRQIGSRTLPRLLDAIAAKLTDREKVDDNRVIAVLAARLLGVEH